MDIVIDLVKFAIKCAVIAVALSIVISIIVGLVRRGRSADGYISVRQLNQRFRDLGDSLRVHVLSKKELKHYVRDTKKADKATSTERRRVFVLDFAGDIAATEVGSLRHEVSAVLAVARPEDEVVVRLESAGGQVHAYGLAASQLERLKQRKLKLVICVEAIAASGGYMMAALADEIIAAPFAILGSIGVVAQVPNFHKLLERAGVEYEEMTAGEFKRTVSLFGAISPDGRKKFQDQLEDTQILFKDFVRTHRAALDVNQVATGEYWFGKRALELKLVDRLATSDDVLLAAAEQADVYHVEYKRPHSIRERVMHGVASGIEKMIVRGLSYGLSTRV